MSSRGQATAATQEQSATEALVRVNEVRLVGRLAAPPELRELPSGDELVVFRVVVPRPEGEPSRVTVDTIDCVARRPEVKRKLLGWVIGDVVEVHGELRRRFFRTPGGAASRYEVECRSSKRLTRAPRAAG